MSKSAVAFGLFIFLLALTGCGGSSSSGDAGGGPAKTSAVGPFDIQFDNAGIFNHIFSANINQPSGKVEYNLTSAKAQYVTVAVAQPSAEGCDLAQVKWSLLWLEDSTQALGVLVKEGSIFYAPTNAAGKHGVLTLVLDNIGACKTVGFTLSLKR